ncbi:hypothetical protein ALC62_09198, partial [Cyphomyrmex costatus]
ELFGSEQALPNTDAWDSVILSTSKAEVRSGLQEKVRLALLAKHELKRELLALEPPKFNREIISTFSKHQSVVNRDEYQAKAQIQVGACLNALGTGISDLLKVNRKFSLQEREAFSKLADGKSAAVQSEVDDWLFGSKFAEEVKSAKALEKTARELAKSIPATATLPKVAHQPIQRRPARKNMAQQSENSKVSAQLSRTRAWQAGTTGKTSQRSHHRSRSRSRARR